MSSTLAYVTPDVLRWARETAGLSIEEAAAKILVKPEKLAAAEEGEALLTLRQAEKAASCYDRTLATLFMPEAPREEPQEQQFRRLPGAPPPPWPPEMQKLARRVQQRQAHAAELYDLREDGAPWARALRKLRADDNVLPTVVRTELGVTAAEQTSWRDTTGYAPLRAWIDAVESLGVLVMQDGSLDVQQMRGFAATHPTVPVIVVNTNDDPRARGWTIVHELAHLLVTALSLEPPGHIEEWCDEFASEVIMPARWLEQRVKHLSGKAPLEAIDEIALTFGVTPLAAAVRVSRRALMDRRTIREVIRRIKLRPPRAKGSGGSPYRNQIARLGPTYIRLVFSALDTQALPLSNAAGLLGTKVNNFEKLRQTLAERGAA